jgi:hypothetical protein
LTSQYKGTEDNGLGVLFVDDGDDEIPTLRKEDQFQPLGDGGDFGLFDEEEESGDH